MIKGLEESIANGQVEQHQNHPSYRTAHNLSPSQSYPQATSRPSTAIDTPAETLPDSIEYATNTGQPTSQHESKLPENPWNSQAILALGLPQ